MLTPEEFSDAVCVGDLPVIEQALSDAAAAANTLGVEDSRARLVNFADDRIQRSTPLQIAAIKGFVRIVEVLLEAGADVNARASNGETALAFAVTLQNSPIVNILLKAGADRNAQHGSEAWTPLMIAVAVQDAQFVNALLEAGADVDTHNQNGQTALVLACGLGQFAAVDCLLKNDANVESRDRNGQIPLQHAVLHGDPAICELLLNYGAELEEIDTRTGGTIFDYAVVENQPAVVEYLLQRYAEKVTEREGSLALHAILRAATYFCTGTGTRLPRPLQVQLPVGKLLEDHFQTLLQSFAQPSLIRSRDDDGGLPLHTAASVDTPNEILLLVVQEHPAALHTRDYAGAVPLHAACQAAPPSSKNTIPLLVELDPAAVHTPNHDGALPFHLLCGANDPPVDAVKYLSHLYPGLVSALTADGALPVMLACEATTSSSSLDVIQELLTVHPDALLYMRNYYSSSE